MKKILLFTLTILLGLMTWADDMKKNVSVPVGGRRTLYMHFNIRSYQMKPKEGIIQVDEDNDDAGKLHIIGLAVGECDLKIEGLGVQETYHIAVISDMVAIKARLDRELRELGLVVETNQDNLIIKGNVSRHDDWETLEKVLTGLDQKRVRNDARYRPGEDDLNQIKNMLGKQFKLVDDKRNHDNLHSGEICLEINDTGLSIVGKGISNKRKVDLERILSRFPWLAVERNADKAKGEISVWLDVFDNQFDIILKQLQEVARKNDGLEVQGTLGHIEIDGKVDSGTAWNEICGIIEGTSDPELVQNKALFVPSVKAVEELEQLFTDKGYECIKTDKVEKYRQLQFRMLSNNSLSVKGQVSNQEQLKDIAETLKDQKWLAVEGVPTHGQAKLNSPKIDVVPVNLAVDIAVIRVSDGITKERGGTKSPISASVDLGKILGIVSGRTWGSAHSYNDGNEVEHGPQRGWNRTRTSNSTRNVDGHGTFNIGLQSVLHFLDSDNITTTYDAGTVKFMDGEKGDFKDGGTVYMAKMVDEEEKMESIEYGLILGIEGTLTTDTTAVLKFDLTNSSMSDDLHKFETSKSTTLNCRLGETIVVATNIQKETNLRNDGLPVLRKVPVVKWLTAEEKNGKSNVQMLILACPRIDEGGPVNMKIDPGDPQKIYDQYEKPQEGNGGKKSIFKPSSWFGK